MKELAKLLILMVIIAGTYSQVSAQKKYTYFSVGAMIGTTQYQGDLDDNGFNPWKGDGKLHLNTIRPSFGFTLNYHFNPHIYVRLGFNQGWIGGADSLSGVETRKQRNLHFRSAISEVTAQAVYEFFATDRHYEYRPKWTPYIFAGLSAFHFNPKALPNADWVERYPNAFKSADEWISLKHLGTEGQTLPDVVRKNEDLPDPYGLTQIAIPMGIGVRYNINKKWDIKAEFSMRKTFTDYLDDVSGPNFANPTDLLNFTNELSFLFADRSSYANYGVGREGVFFFPGSNETAQNIFKGAYGDGNGGPKMLRGNKNDKDWFGFFQIGVTYIIDSGAKCPRFRKQ